MNRRSRILNDEDEFSPMKSRPDSEGHLWVELDKSRGSASSFNHHEIDEEVLQSIRNKMGNKIFCGLPIYALPQTTSAMTYQSRKPIVETVKIYSSNDYWSTDHGSVASDELKPSTPSLLKKDRTHGHIKESEAVGANHFAAQRKVSQALLTMANNEAMMKYFLHKGGLDAILRLVRESKDFDVLKCCALSLIQACKQSENCQVIVDRNVFSAIATLIDIFVVPANNNGLSNAHNTRERQRSDSLGHGSENEKQDTMRHLIATLLANLSCSGDRGLDEVLVLNGIINMIQTLAIQLNRVDTICMLMLTLANICPVVNGADAETAIRICFQSTKKVDVVKSVSKALFVSDLYNNFSRINHYSSLLVDEGLMPMLLHLIDIHLGVDDILKKCTEALSNLSINRKNRREIASSGIASRLTLLFEKGSATTRAYTLLIMGNLLSSGLFYDKVANVHTISYILDHLLDKNYPKQFAAVSFCLSQLSKVEHSCEVLVQCDVIPILLAYLRESPPESLDNLWTVLVNISKHTVYFTSLMKEVRPLIVELYEEVKNDESSVHQRQCVVQISLNLSRMKDFGSHLDTAFTQKFIKTLKLLFSSKLSPSRVQHFCLVALTNFANYCESSRSAILDTDLIDIFQDKGFTDERLNVKYAAVLNIISNDEACIYRLIDQGAQKLLVSLQDSFAKLTMKESGDLTLNKRKEFKRGQSTLNLKEMMKSGAFQFLSGDDTDSNPSSPSKNANASLLAEQLSEGELGKELSAATLHNLAIKRPVLSPGVLVTLLSLAKNTKTRRVLLCVRSLANMSVHPKSKVALNKEGRRIIPLLTVTMRTGCVEAEKVQHYCALTLCNILAAPLDRAIFTDLIKSGTIVDLVVVTLLRINSNVTKEMLGKTLFNFLSRPDIREILVSQLDMLAAILELCKVEFMNLLELCTKILYNITCELSPGLANSDIYAKKLSSLKVPHLLVGRLVHNTKISGAKTNTPVRALLGMAIANMSFQKLLVVELAQEHFAIADAMVRVNALDTEEATFSAMVTLFNISHIAECISLAGSKAINLMVDVLDSAKGNSVLVTKLCVGCLCNFSNMPVFQEQLTNVAIPSIVRVLAAPHFHMSVKRDVIQILYNLVNMYRASKEVFISNGAVVALWKTLKVQGGGGGGGGGASVPESNSSVAATESVEENTTTVAGDDDNLSEEESVILLIGHVVKSLCDEASEFGLMHKRVMADGVMNILLKLSKIEMPILKLDMSFAIYSLAKSDLGDVIKVLRTDSVDILFWLTIYDTMNLHDVILKNVSRALRCFTSTPESCRILVKQERFFSVIKALIKSKNEDVLWQTAAVLYNLMQIDVCTKILLEKGLISYIFDLAASNYNSVRHVCSACLHLIPNNMPSMDDPEVLQLVLCLLEADGDRFAQLGERPTDVLHYNSLVEKCYAGTLFKHNTSGFTSSWHVQNCGVDSAFYPALIFLPDDKNIEITVAANKSGGENGSPMNGFESHEKISSSTYNDFQKDNQVSAAVAGVDGSAVSLNPPALPSKAPPGYGATATVGDLSKMDASYGHDSKQSAAHLRDSGKHNDWTGTLHTISDSKNKLPLIQPPKSLPENTVDAIQRSIAKSSKSQPALGNSLASPLLEAGFSGKGLPKSVIKNASSMNPMVSINQYGNSGK